MARELTVEYFDSQLSDKLAGVESRFVDLESRFDGKLDNLAQMIQRGFAEITSVMITKIELDERLAGLENRMNNRFDVIELETNEDRKQPKRIDGHDTAIVDLNIRVDRLEKKNKLR